MFRLHGTTKRRTKRCARSSRVITQRHCCARRSLPYSVSLLSVCVCGGSCQVSGAAQFPVGRWSCYVARATTPRLPCNCFTGEFASATTRRNTRRCLIYGSVCVRRAGWRALSRSGRGWSVGVDRFQSVYRIARGGSSKWRVFARSNCSHFINIWRAPSIWRLLQLRPSVQPTCLIFFQSLSCNCDR